MSVSYWGHVATGFLWGFMVAAGYSSIAGLRSKNRIRRGAKVEVGIRDLLSKARFHAFEDMYSNYRNPFAEHFLTEEDREDVQEVIAKKLLEQSGNQGLIYQQADLDQEQILSGMARDAIKDAEKLFLQI